MQPCECLRAQASDRSMHLLSPSSRDTLSLAAAQLGLTSLHLTTPNPVHIVQRDWCCIAKQPASAPHMLRIVPHTVPRVGRAYEHGPDGFELHILLHRCTGAVRRARRAESSRSSRWYRLLVLQRESSLLTTYWSEST